MQRNSSLKKGEKNEIVYLPFFLFSCNFPPLARVTEGWQSGLMHRS